MTTGLTEGRSIGRALLLLVWSILISLLGSFAATGLAMRGVDLFWLASLAGYAVGLVGALLLMRYCKAYGSAAVTFAIGGLTVAVRQFRLTVYYAYGVTNEGFELLWFVALAVVTLLNYGAMYGAVREHLRAAAAPEPLQKQGARWVQWTAVALLLNLVSIASMSYLSLSGEWYALIQLCVVMVAFAFMVSALVVGIRYLLGARKFFLQQSGRKT